MTPNKARFLCELNIKGWANSCALRDALRSLADQVEALEGQALSSIEREEYFKMKEDAERYRWLRSQPTLEDCIRFLDHEKGEDVDAAIDRAREAT